LVSAADVAYILLNERAAKSEILGVFSELNLSVDKIKDKNILNYDLSDYRLIFIDDVRLRKTKNLAIYNYPSVIMNRYYTEEWGLTDADGASQLAANSPLNVKVDDLILQVYTKAKEGSINLPYYYLADEDKASGLISIARTYTGSTYNPEIGDVIAVAPIGMQLVNGKVAGAKLCFYGISKTKYWTENARNLFIDCVASVLTVCENDNDCNDNNNYTADSCENPGTIASQCVHEPIACLSNADCDDSNAYTQDTCNFPGTPESFCSYINIICLSDIDCNDGNAFTEDNCINPSTINSYCDYGNIICFNDLDCNDGNAYTEDICNNPGTSNSYCSYNSINCINDLDCNDNNDYTVDICQNPGASSSFCENLQIVCLTDIDCGISGLIGDPFCSANKSLVLVPLASIPRIFFPCLFLRENSKLPSSKSSPSLMSYPNKSLRIYSTNFI